MSDQDEPDVDETGFDDPGHDELRALLAGARVTESMPDDVAARLDATLVSLQAERAAESAVVVPLRRRVGRVLVAAAAVVVIGAGGVGIVKLGGSTSNSDDSTSAGDRPATVQEDAGGTGTSGSTAGSDAIPRELDSLLSKGVPQLAKATFRRDAARLMRATYNSTADTASGPTPEPSSSPSDDADVPLTGYAAKAPAITATPQRTDTSTLTRELAACPGPKPVGAVTLPALLDGDSVALVFLTPTATEQQVQAWSCDGTTLLASALIAQ